MSYFNRPVEILLIEDSNDDIFLLKEVLKDAKIPINLRIVTDGKKAIEYLYKQGSYTDSFTPDLILLDLNLPKIDGREILTRLKSDEQLRMIPVIVLTTSQSEEDIDKSYLHNANCYITKPVDLQEFVKVVNTIEDFWLSTVRLPSKEI